MLIPITNSRQVTPGDTFIAIPCANVQEHIQQAIDRGAQTLMMQEAEAGLWRQRYPHLEIISLENPRLTWAMIVKSFYPRQPQRVTAVTGTNGKSSVVHLARQLWSGCGLEAASLGTLGLVVDDHLNPDFPLPSLTTLDSLHLHQALNYLYDASIDYVALEASSHGLDQYRLHRVELQAAGFTNLTQDHLDYHASMEHYFLSKVKLFTEILPVGKTAVLNRDSPYFDRLRSLCQKRQHRLLTYSLEKDADLRIRNVFQKSDYLGFDLEIAGQSFTNLSTPLVGRFQLENLLCALGLCLATEAPLDRLMATLPCLKSVKGRMEWVGSYRQASIFVDYAHTPDALETVLENLRPHTLNRLWVVFGCGGNRDSSKRPKMGGIAQRLADCVIVTDDNPRHEDPVAIRQQILAACPKGREMADRREAIRSTIAQLEPGDIVLVAGKGHETGQIIGETVHPFSDQEEIETVLKEYKDGNMAYG